MIAIDFDETLHDRSNVKPGYKMGVPVLGALEAVNELIARGYRPYVLTASSHPRIQAIQDWLAYFKFPPMRVTSEKTISDYYVDDRAIKFVSWKQVLEDLGE